MSAQAADAVIEWYSHNRRDLPWRESGTTAWGVIVCEVMAQQTPVTRVAPQWVAWMQRWPTPAELAAATPAEVLVQWDRLGYPRRALRLRECAIALTNEHDGQVPADYTSLIALPGIGDYTASAVLAFAFGKRALVMDTNVRRVAARAFGGVAHHRPHVTSAERRALDEVTPSGATAATFSQAMMELGAIVCRPEPACGACPLEHVCQWRANGHPPAEHRARRPQTFAGTDRQVRGLIMKLLRNAQPAAVPHATIEGAWHDSSQIQRALASLLADGLAEKTEGGSFSLPASST